MKHVVPLICLTALLAGTARAEFKVGDPAPPLKIEKWVSGKPVVLSEGRDKSIYVVEFWATWCPPCVQSVPHLSKIAQRFAKNGVTIVGVSIDSAQTRAKVEPFVKERGNRMSYTVALDDGGATSAAYMDAAGVQGIPHAFIIGKDGKLAWHGHPMEGLDLKLAEMVGDKSYAESAKLEKTLRSKLGMSLGAEKWEEALLTVEKLLEVDPEQSDFQALKYQLLATKLKKGPEAEKWGREVLKKSTDKDLMNALAWGILTDEDYEGVRDLKLALSAAQKANELTGGKDWSILDTYARALFDTGDKQRAIELEIKALEIAKNEKERVDPSNIEAMNEALERYRGGKGEAKPEKAAPPAKEDKGAKE